LYSRAIVISLVSNHAAYCTSAPGAGQ